MALRTAMTSEVRSGLERRGELEGEEDEAEAKLADEAETKLADEKEPSTQIRGVWREPDSVGLGNPVAKTCSWAISRRARAEGVSMRLGISSSTDDTTCRNS